MVTVPSPPSLINLFQALGLRIIAHIPIFIGELISDITVTLKWMYPFSKRWSIQRHIFEMCAFFFMFVMFQKFHIKIWSYSWFYLICKCWIYLLLVTKYFFLLIHQFKEHLFFFRFVPDYKNNYYKLSLLYFVIF